MPGPQAAQARQTNHGARTQQPAKGLLWGRKAGRKQAGALKCAAATGIGATASMPCRYALCARRYARCDRSASVLAIRILVRSETYFPAADLAGRTAGYAINFILSLAWV